MCRQIQGEWIQQFNKTLKDPAFLQVSTSPPHAGLIDRLVARWALMSQPHREHQKEKEKFLERENSLNNPLIVYCWPMGWVLFPFLHYSLKTLKPC